MQLTLYEIIYSNNALTSVSTGDLHPAGLLFQHTCARNTFLQELASEESPTYNINIKRQLSTGCATQCLISDKLQTL